MKDAMLMKIQFTIVLGGMMMVACCFAFIGAVALYVVGYILKYKGKRNQIPGARGVLYFGVIALSFISVYYDDGKSVQDIMLAAAIIMTAVFEMGGGIEEFLHNKGMTLKKTEIKVKMKHWYIFLATLSSIYVIFNFNEIGSLKQLEVSAIIFVVWIALLLYPLFSSIQVGGFKLTKQIEQMREETKEAMNDIKMQILDVKVDNSNSNTVVVSPILAYEELNNIKDKIEEKAEESETNKRKEVSEEVVSLFKVRFDLEQLISSLSKKYGYSGNSSLNQMIKFLVNNGIIDINYNTIISNIINICNRAIHGESIAAEYISFVQETTPMIKEQLENEMRQDVNYHVCMRCGYRGPSKFENYCPNCGNVTCEC